MNWLIFAMVSVISISIANIYQRIMMRDQESDPLASSIFFIFFTGCLTGIFAIINGFVMPNLLGDWQFYLISTICYALGTLSFFQAAKLIEASEIVILSSFGAVVTIVLALIFLGESFTWIQAIGVILILSSIIFVQKDRKILTNTGSLYAIIGTSLYGIAVVSDTFILKHYDAASYVSVISFLPALFLLLIRPDKIVRLRSYFRISYLKNIFLYSLFYGIQAITYYFALQHGANASRMATIIRSEIVLTVLLAAIILKEREKIYIKIFSHKKKTGKSVLRKRNQE